MVADLSQAAFILERVPRFLADSVPPEWAVADMAAGPQTGHVVIKQMPMEMFCFMAPCCQCIFNPPRKMGISNWLFWTRLFSF